MLLLKPFPLMQKLTSIESLHNIVDGVTYKLALRNFHKHTIRCQQTQPKSIGSAELSPGESEPLRFEPVIGLEVHAQISTLSKLFSPAAVDYYGRPNSQVAPFDLSLPGTLPVLNRCCVDAAIRTGLVLDCHFPSRSTFDRKHYFYGDMPNGYQITQQREPIAHNGVLEFIVFDQELEYSNLQVGNHQRQHLWPHKAYLKRCQLKQIQLEQDSGKSLADAKAKRNLVDLNRAGVALMEFVFEPELYSVMEATSLVRELILRLKAIDVCNCRMDQGALRVDANVSVRPVSSAALGTRTEIKNLNSFRALRGAIEYEIERQSTLLRLGQRVINETMGYDTRTKQTFVMRDKEIVQDYRFMPEPNLPPILLNDSDTVSADRVNVGPIRASILTESLPQSVRSHLLRPEYKLTLREVFFLVTNIELRQLFLDIFAVSKRKNGQEIFDFVQQLFSVSLLNNDYTWTMKIDASNIRSLAPMAHFAELIDLFYTGDISVDTAYDIVKLYIANDSRTPRAIVEQNNWWVVTDPVQLEQVCRQVADSLGKVARKFAKNGVRRPNSMLISKAQEALGNQANEEQLWQMYEKILRKKD